MKDSSLSRRDFLQLSALSVAGLRLAGAPGGPSAGARVALVAAPDDPVASAPPVRWAVEELRAALSQRGVTVDVLASLDHPAAADLWIVVAGATNRAAAQLLDQARVSVPDHAESLALVPFSRDGRAGILATGRDARGAMYAVLELEERVRYGDDGSENLRASARTVEQPFNAVRAIGRPFASHVEDKPWFDDRAFWPAYFGMLARQRFNRFHMCLGLGYDTLRWVADAYLLYAYPFLVAVPGYDVRAVDLPNDERDRNLETLRFIGREAARHGLDFQLGLWTHGYQWADSPDANYTIAGLTSDTLAAYSRDALTAVLQACPDVTGVTLRTHYESGVHEGSYGFWKTIFDGVARSGRRLEIELHAKGLDQRMIDGALSTGLPVRVSPKYWAEHMGLPYQQAAIRELELPKVNTGDSFSALSMGARNHTRYGHADFMRRDRAFSVMYRVFPGTHKFLLWADPVTAAAHARAFRFCGSEGAELFEPLAFKGRRGSGRPGGRCAYADTSLAPRRDWEKYLYTYLAWGRLLYNPDAEPETWRRLLRRQYGAGASAVEAGLGAATRILPIVTTAHLPSAAQDTYSPEFYTNQSILDPKASSPYGDTPQPRVFGTVSPLDPQLFSTIDAFADRLAAGERDPRYSPVDAAQWLDDLAATALAAVERAERDGRSGDPELRRATIDIRLQAYMGRFFAAKLRAGALYALYSKTGERDALEEALRLYRDARESWSRAAGTAAHVYVADVTFGPLPHQRGHWADRLKAMDTDIGLMERTWQSAPAGTASSERVRAAIASIVGGSRREPADAVHVPPARVVAARAIDLSLDVRRPASPSAVRLCYRHVNQAERYQVAEMRREGGSYRATIPGSYTDSAFPLQYYFEIRQDREHAWLYPGFNRDLTNQPYFVVAVAARD